MDLLLKKLFIKQDNAGNNFDDVLQWRLFLKIKDDNENDNVKIIDITGTTKLLRRCSPKCSRQPRCFWFV